MLRRLPLIVVLAIAAALMGPGCSTKDDTRESPEALAPAAEGEVRELTAPASAPKATQPAAPAATSTTRENYMSEAAGQEAKNPVVIIETSMGTIEAELWADKAPVTVANFLMYVDEGFYDGLIFHRVIDGFMIQGGGFTPDMKKKATHADIKNEAAAELRNVRGTLAMARSGKIHSASSQFFINLVNNSSLDHKDETSRGFGYCAFGKVLDGMGVVDKIAKVKTHWQRYDDVPVEPVVIRSIRRMQ